MILVSIVVPTYKRPDKLRYALRSILAQTYKNIEVVLVDDNGEGSCYDKETMTVVEEFSSVFKKFIFVKNKKNMGGGGARNEGIRVSNGEYIAFLDDDDQYLENKIELQVNQFQKSKYTNLAVVYCQMTLFDESTGAKLLKTRNHYNGNKIPFEENMNGCIASTQTILAKKSVLQDVGGFRDFKSGQDWALILDILLAGFEVESMNESLVNVYISSGDRISNSPNKVKSLEGEIKTLKDQVICKISDESLVQKIYYHHYLQLANALKFKDKKKALFYYSKMTQYGFDISHTAKFYFGLIFGEKVSVSTRLFMIKILG